MTDRTILDACVLYPASLRDLLLSIAYVGGAFPLWSDDIHDEWMRNLLKDRPDLTRETLERTRRTMDRQFPHSLVRDYRSLIAALQLPDPNDRHVLAVAIKAGAKFIVTFNLKHFPKVELSKHRIEALSPDDFALRLIEYDSVHFLSIVKHHRSILQNPPKTVDEYLATLENQRLPKTVKFLREHRNEI